MKRPGHKSKTGFTIIELMVVIGIIIILAGIGLVTMNVLNEQAVKDKTRMVIRGAAGAGTEYEAQIASVINHTGSSPVDWGTNKTGTADTSVSEPATSLSSIERFVWALWQIEDTQNRLKRFDDMLVDADGDGFYELNDGWGRPLEYVDGTNAPLTPMPTPNSNFSTLPRRNAFFLACAGPDGEWGVVNNQNQPDDPAKDNIYSFDME